MQQLAIAANAAPVVTLIDGQAVTTSQEVARVFGKDHRHVLDAIRNLLPQLPPEHLPDFRQTVVSRPNPSGGAPIESPAYKLNRNAFVVLAMGFTGKRALQFKLAYIAEFNRLEAQARQSAIDFTAARTQAAALGLAGEREMFKALLAGNPHVRVLGWLTRDGKADAKVVPPDAVCMGFAEMAQAIEQDGLAAGVSTDDLLALANACVSRVRQRERSQSFHQRRLAA